MERKEFLKACGYACMGGAFFSQFLAGCTTSKIFSGVISGSDLVVPVASFLKKDKTFRQYIVVHNGQLEYPLCLYRFSETAYTALYMRCPHQGAELQVFGDRLQCPAHGSEFDNRGVVKTGPAETNLRNFPVTIQGGQIKISLT